MTDIVEVTADAPGGRRPRRASVVRPTRLTVVVAVVLMVIVVSCLAASMIAPYDHTEQSALRFAGPSAQHWFGTDELGRDLFSRALYGGRLTILVTGGAAVIALVLGTAWGMAAAFARGILDEILMRLADTVMAIPQILFALVFVAAFDATPLKLAVIIGVLLTPTTARMVRSAVLTELQDDYYAAAIAYGAPRRRLLSSEVLPNIRAAIGVQTAINAANAIILEAALSFVGLGIQPPDASWGTLVQQGYQKMYQSLGYVLFPTMLIFVTIWMLNLLADQLGAGRDPRGRAA